MDDGGVVRCAVSVGGKVGHGNRGSSGVEQHLKIAEHRLEAGDGWSGRDGTGQKPGKQRQNKDPEAEHAGKMPSIGGLVNPPERIRPVAVP